MKSEITHKLADISLVVSDACYFAKMRFFLEEMERRNDKSADELISIVDNFYKLCKYIEESK